MANAQITNADPAGCLRFFVSLALVIPIFSTVAAVDGDDYRYDRGKSDRAFGMPDAGVLAWLQHFTVIGGRETITTVSVAIGTPMCCGYPPEGTPFAVGIWSDPDQDGHPADGALLSSAVGEAEQPGTDILQRVDVPDVFVGPAGTSFFVVAWSEHPDGLFPAAMDVPGPREGRNRAWATGEVGGTFDPNGFNPENGWFRMDEIGLPSVWLLRAGAGGFDPGDLNCDGSIDLADVEPFLVALTDPDEYETRYEDCDINLADLNDDGSVDLQDVEPFIELLIGP